MWVGVRRAPGSVGSVGSEGAKPMSHAWSWTRGVQTFGIAALAGAIALAGCGGGGGNGSGGGDGPEAGTVDSSPQGGGDAGDAGNLIGNAPQLKAITITPL